MARSKAERLAENPAFAHYIDIMWERENRTPAELDALVDRIAAGIQVDCTQCGNCCRYFHVGITPDDLPRLASAVGQPPETIAAQLLDFDCEGEWAVFHGPPCLFLRPDNLCQIYTSRPDACRIYPSLTPDFRWLVEELMEGAVHCAIIDQVIEQLKSELGW
jgi:Fe-S-cluster containining protein